MPRTPTPSEVTKESQTGSQVDFPWPFQGKELLTKADSLQSTPGSISAPLQQSQFRISCLQHMAQQTLSFLTRGLHLYQTSVWKLLDRHHSQDVTTASHCLQTDSC